LLDYPSNYDKEDSNWSFKEEAVHVTKPDDHVMDPDLVLEESDSQSSTTGSWWMLSSFASSDDMLLKNSLQKGGVEISLVNNLTHFKAVDSPSRKLSQYALTMVP
jgi:hypothetical protein